MTQPLNIAQSSEQSFGPTRRTSSNSMEAPAFLESAIAPPLASPDEAAGWRVIPAEVIQTVGCYDSDCAGGCG